MRKRATNEVSFEDERLWEYMLTQDAYVVSQFANAVIGVGALFFAYGVITSGYLRELIALIGLGASVILWMHAWGANREHRAVLEELEKTRPSLINRFKRLTSWRHRGKYRFLYYPIKRLIVFFMEFMALAWLTIFLFYLGIPFSCLLHFDILVFAITLIYGVGQRYGDIRRTGRTEPE